MTRPVEVSNGDKTLHIYQTDKHNFAELQRDMQYHEKLLQKTDIEKLQREQEHEKVQEELKKDHQLKHQFEHPQQELQQQHQNQQYEVLLQQQTQRSA
eukprot:CAMPEP_0194344678 /NCGR_PEP_ID=MMETSP0171-20130528/102471_1 /TAXON_ID=218684 /ORGANISM="Corethron pennatum, Strain L29A3" /LENGTH=97 /DNA_ID=CAMNT_0039111441 /DNA_START=27 /DNA_END=316 /DNA_ORIENTATION=+